MSIEQFLILYVVVSAPVVVWTFIKWFLREGLFLFGERYVEGRIVAKGGMYAKGELLILVDNECFILQEPTMVNMDLGAYICFKTNRINFIRRYRIANVIGNQPLPK
jgi:hypothetical protein